MELSVKVWKKNQEYIASCPELDVFCYGNNRGNAKDRLKKVIVFYAETASQLGYDIKSEDLINALEVENPKIKTSNQMNASIH